ncbi:MAG TPA: hypothetical protein VE843_00060, partial [Ktedonobacteraceae bacterium]|nr:hypothetical protein [Ktedonobacteraceae bacterium]
MINQPDTQEQEPQSEKLVLPAPPAEEQQMYYGGQMAQIRPEQLIRRQAQLTPTGIRARLVYYWHKDPAYKVLMIAMTMVLVAGVIFVSLASAALLGNANFFASSYIPQAVPKGVNPTVTVNLRPTFAAPGGGVGTNQQSSQPPMQSTPALQATNPTSQPSPTPGGGGELNVQFTSLPQRVRNGSYVSVGVNAGKPNVSVELVIRYGVQGGRSTAGPQTTDSNGNAAIGWFVFAYGLGQKNVQAFVYALAT